jgi:hypothetical protein
VAFGVFFCGKWRKILWHLAIFELNY